MKKYLFAGSIVLIALIALLYSNQKPSIEVSAEANATSTVIVPKVSHETAKPEPKAEPQENKTVYIHQTYEQPRETVKEPIVEPIKEPVKEPVETTITYVPQPIYTTVYVPEPTAPVYQPVTEPMPNEPAPIASVPVEEPVEAPTFTQEPKIWVEERYNGDWIFFEAKWEATDKGIVTGVIKCNDIFMDKSVRSGFASTVVISTSPFASLPPGSLVACTFSVEGIGWKSFNYTTK